MTYRFVRTAAVALAVAALAVACKDATLGPAGNGSVAGLVLDAETSEPLAGVSVTTTPPSDVLVTDSAGQFSLDELAAGNYQITAKKHGYQQTTVSLAVRGDRTSNATLFLEKGDSTDARVALSAEVLSFWNTQQGDTVYAEVEYRVRNTGEVAIDSYDVNFRITTTQSTRYQQEHGTNLGVGREVVDRFKLYIQDAKATDATVESVWTDPTLTPSE